MRENHEEDYLDIGKRIAYYRQKRGMSQERLGEKLNCSPQEIQQIEGDYLAKKTLSGFWSVKNLDFLFVIADVLEMDVLPFFLPVNDENFEKYRKDK